MRAFVLFHSKCHPRELGLPAVTRFLEHIVRTEKQPLPALETARSALELLYGPVLGIDLGELPRPQPPRLLDQMSQGNNLSQRTRRAPRTASGTVFLGPLRAPCVLRERRSSVRLVP